MCYRMECIRKCDRFARQTCQYKLNQRQLEYKIKIGRYTCMECGGEMVQAKYMGNRIIICTRCNHVLRELQRAYVS